MNQHELIADIKHNKFMLQQAEAKKRAILKDLKRVSIEIKDLKQKTLNLAFLLDKNKEE